MKTKYAFSLIVFAISIVACNSETGKNGEKTINNPSHVELRNTDGTYRIFVNGEEFFVKGAGCEFGACNTVASHGGNSIRTWRINNGQKKGKEVLDDALENGLMVMMGIDVARERHGFDYNNQDAVAAQLESIKKDIIELKDHPALLGWGVGNELNLHYTNNRVWDAVDDIAKMIKEIDKNHIVTTMLAGIGKKEADYIRDYCPNLDFISIQMYGDIVNLAQRITDSGYEGPYLVTEWGATGHWEMPQTEWSSPIEQTSSEKADALRFRYEKVIMADKAKCLGSYVFLWGQKQERTPTWYGLITENGEKTEAINVMEYLWTGKWPQKMAPKIIEAKITGKGGRFDNVKLDTNTEYSTQIEIKHPDPEILTARAEILPEPVEIGDGGDFEPRPKTIEGLIISINISNVSFKSPAEKGKYRLFIYIADDDSNVGTVNIPFLVQ